MKKFDIYQDSKTDKYYAKMVVTVFGFVIYSNILYNSYRVEVENFPHDTWETRYIRIEFDNRNDLEMYLMDTYGTPAKDELIHSIILPIKN